MPQNVLSMSTKEVRKCLRHMNRKSRHIVLWFLTAQKHGNLSVRRAADQFGVREDRVHSLLGRALDEFHELLADRMGTWVEEEA